MLDALIVHAVLVILVLLSVVTWTLAWLKIRQNQKAVSDMKNFEQQFLGSTLTLLTSPTWSCLVCKK